MLARLGFMLYVLSWILAFPFLALMFMGWGSWDVIDGTGQFAAAAIGVSIVLIGRGIYYILSGR